MIIKFATCLLALAAFTACSTTTTSTAQRESAAPRMSMEQRLLAQNAGYPSSDEPAPPAEGPEDIPAEGPVDPNRNPGLLPTPLLRANAAAGL